MASTIALFTRLDGQIVPLPSPDGDLGANYKDWVDKGVPMAGRRLSIATLHAKYKVGETFHVIHVLETVSEDLDAYIMGPKEVFGEYLDGIPSSRAWTAGEDPFTPLEYDGRVVRGPYWDAHFIHTNYTFMRPGTHEIVWRLGGLQSNTLKVEIE